MGTMTYHGNDDLPIPPRRKTLYFPQIRVVSTHTTAMHGSKKKLTQAERRSLRSRAARQRGPPEAEEHVPPRPLLGLCRKHVYVCGKLHTAAREGRSLRRVCNLVSRGANVEAVDEDGLTALMLAARNGHTDTVNALAGTYNANVEAVDQNGWTALMLAAYYGHTDTVNALAGTHNANVETANERGGTALIIAAQNGHADTVNVLGTYNANVEAVDEDGWTALMLATYYGHTDTVNALEGM